MTSPARPLAWAIAEKHRRWGGDVVSSAIFGTTDAGVIAEKIDGFSRRTLGAGVAAYGFYSASVASVHGVVLQDGRRVVIKVHGRHVPRARIDATADIQSELAREGFPAPMPLTRASPFGNGHAIVETWLDGTTYDGHDRDYRRVIATTFSELVERCRRRTVPFRYRGPFAPTTTLWPRPHSPLFDFDGTARGAAWIDRWAIRARRQLAEHRDAGSSVVAHNDWRAGNLRLDRRHRRIVAAYDWVSLRRDREPVHVGAVAHAFCADWDRDERPAPSVDEIRAFVADYEAARGRAFSADERRSMAAALTYATAYVARCEHAVDANGTASNAFRSLLREHGKELLTS